jgi:hypothetical protein
MEKLLRCFPAQRHPWPKYSAFFINFIKQYNHKIKENKMEEEMNYTHNAFFAGITRNCYQRKLEEISVDELSEKVKEQQR